MLHKTLFHELAEEYKPAAAGATSFYLGACIEIPMVTVNLTYKPGSPIRELFVHAHSFHSE